MTMTLDEVNQIRFPMARRPNEGYRAQEVDEFVDRVVATFQSMQDENERSKAQVEALKSDQFTAQGGGQPDQGLVDENNQLKAQVAELRERADREPTNQSDEGLRHRTHELEQRNAELERQLAEARQQANEAQQALQAERDRAAAAPSAEQAQPLATGQVADTPRTEALDASHVQHGTGKLERVVVTTAADASKAVIRLVQLATEQAEGVVRDAERDADGLRTAAEADARKTREDADTYAAETTKAADEKSARIGAEAQQNADTLLANAKSNADQVETDAKTRRSELFQTLEAERDEFAGKVDQLKAWEGEYRSSITKHLREQAEALESGVFSPASNAALLGDERSTSATPRLDALLAEKH